MQKIKPHKALQRFWCQSTVKLPHIIESNDKKYARIKALKIIVDALEKACDRHFENLFE
jgi:polyphosphate kinase 2 (PPK2 family)